MPVQTLNPTISLDASERDNSVASFASVLQRALGEAAWASLAPAIRLRFAGCLSAKRGLLFTGTMQWVYCSPLGALLMKLLRRFCILPATCVRDSQFSFHIGMANGQIVKQRNYQMAGQPDFEFRSRFADSPRLYEEFAGGIGMYLALAVKQRALLFRDQGYFWRFRRWRLHVPGWLAVGHFELLHRNIDQQRYQIVIRVAHPLFGTLFYQRGEFQREESV